MLERAKGIINGEHVKAPVRREELSKQIAEAAKAIGIHGSGSAHSFRKAGGNAI